MRNLLFMGLLLTAMSVRASDYKSLVFQDNSGTTAIDLSSLVITVADGKLIATNTTGTVTFTLSDLTKMYFSNDEATGIKQAETTGEASLVQVYDIAGRSMGSFDTLTAAKAQLRQGVYVIKQDNKTYKIVVR